MYHVVEALSNLVNQKSVLLATLRFGKGIEVRKKRNVVKKRENKEKKGREVN